MADSQEMGPPNILELMRLGTALLSVTTADVNEDERPDVVAVRRMQKAEATWRKGAAKSDQPSNWGFDKDQVATH